MTLLFHSDVFVPEHAQKLVHQLQRNLKDYYLSKHFEEHLNNQYFEDRSHLYLKDIVENCLEDINTQSQDAFEVELTKSFKEFGTHAWLVTKYCIRIPYDNDTDLVIVIRPHWNKKYQCYNSRDNLIVTAWINHKEDNHKTLDTTKYCSKNRWLVVK